MGASAEMSRPACTIRPAVCTSRPAMMRSSVVLPHPEGPRKHNSSPGWTSRLTPFSAANSPNSLRIPESSRKAMRSLLRLHRISSLPLGEDLVAVRRRVREVVPDKAAFEVRGDVGEGRLHVGMRDDGEILLEAPVRLLGRDPIHELIRRVHLRHLLPDGRGLELP